MNAWTPEHLAMDALWEAETAPVLWVQGWGDWLAVPLGLITGLGSQIVAVALLALVFWCVHPGVGVRLFVAVIVSGALNYLLKALICGARPYWYSPHVAAHATASSFGMPSGHAQTSIVVWGYLGARSGRRVWIWAAAVLITLICLSRVYLGVHFVSDVLVGLLVGGAVLWAALRWEDRVLAWWRSLRPIHSAGCALVLSLTPCAVAIAWQRLARPDWTVPVEWTGATPTDPAGYTLVGLFSVAGAILGGTVGFTLLSGRGWYSAGGTVLSRVARFVLGVSGIVLTLVLAAVLFGGFTGLAEPTVAFAVYALIAFWASFGAPEVFIRGGLARRPDPEDTPAGGPTTGEST